MWLNVPPTFILLHQWAYLAVILIACLICGETDEKKNLVFFWNHLFFVVFETKSLAYASLELTMRLTVELNS